MLLAQVAVGEITQILRVMAVLRTIAVLGVTAVLRIMAAVVFRVPSFLLSDSHNILKQLQAAVLKGTKRAATIKVLGPVAVITVDREVMHKGVLTPRLSRKQSKTPNSLLGRYLFVVIGLVF